MKKLFLILLMSASSLSAMETTKDSKVKDPVSKVSTILQSFATTLQSSATKKIKAAIELLPENIQTIVNDTYRNTTGKKAIYIAAAIPIALYLACYYYNYRINQAFDAGEENAQKEALGIIAKYNGKYRDFRCDKFYEKYDPTYLHNYGRLTPQQEMIVQICRK